VDMGTLEDKKIMVLSSILLSGYGK